LVSWTSPALVHASARTARVEQVEIVLDLLLLGRAGEHHSAAALLQVLDQFARAGERLDLADQLGVQHLLGRADVVALLFLYLLAAECLDQLVAAHADVPVDPPDRQHDLVLVEGPVPRDRVLEVRVDQGAVDVENRRGGHPRCVPAGALI
jgi:hypothetical protein